MHIKNDLSDSPRDEKKLPSYKTTDAETDITKEDLDLLKNSEESMPTADENNLRKASLDSTDEDGDPLNEESFGSETSGADLDIPGSEDDNVDEAIGEEDEENNFYSLGGDAHDNLEEDNS